MLKAEDPVQESKQWINITIVKALRQLANTTLLVEFRVMQFTIDLQHKKSAWLLNSHIGKLFSMLVFKFQSYLVIFHFSFLIPYVNVQIKI